MLPARVHLRRPGSLVGRPGNRRQARPAQPDRDRAAARLPEELLPDISFLGFALDPATARGTDTPSTGPAGDGAGWFIVIEQQPTAPRYGLDETAPASDPAGWTWRDLAWPHVGLTEPGGCVRVGAGLDASFPAAARRGPTGEAWRWDAASSDSAQLACITLQGPVWVAIHASDLL